LLLLSISACISNGSLIDGDEAASFDFLSGQSIAKIRIN